MKKKTKLPDMPVEVKDNKETFDEIVTNSEMFTTLKQVLSERGYIVVKEAEIVQAFASLRIVPGNEARKVVRNIITKILGKEVEPMT